MPVTRPCLLTMPSSRSPSSTTVKYVSTTSRYSFSNSASPKRELWIAEVVYLGVEYQSGQGFCRLTVTHGSGGWNWILSDLKNLLETRKNLA
jgi:hypothetical protein